MKRTVVTFGAFLACMVTYGATCYYVDANHGNDLWDGTSATVPTTGTQGPKKTLAAAMGISGLTSGDTVYVAEGTYDDGEMTNFRVRIPAGVKLIATGSQAATVIAGRSSTGPETEYEKHGCGPGALRCVYVGANAHLIGFTVSGGRALNVKRYEDGQVGGIDGAGSDKGSLIVNCQVTNCIAGADAGARNVNAIRCHFRLNAAAVEGGHHLRGGTAWNCYFESIPDSPYRDWYGRYGCYEVTLRNCRTLCVSWYCHAYNSYCSTNEGTDFHYSNFYTLGTNSTADEHCPAKTGSYEMVVDADLRPVKGQNLGLDNGNYEMYVGSATAAELAYLDKDYAGGQRVYNGTIDRGPGERDYRGDFTTLLAGTAYAGRLMVDEATGGVVPSGSTLTLPGGDALTVTWNDAPIPAVDFGYSFTANVTGEATLSLYQNGSAMPLASYTAADGTVTPVYTASGTNSLRLVVTGAGSASISDWQATDYWYVDAVNGANGYDGKSATVESAARGPKGSLYRIMDAIYTARTKGKVKVTEIVYAAPGVYASDSYGKQRVRIFDDVKLIASGSKEETVIEGLADPSDEKTGCGANALSGCYMNTRSMLRGFTIRNGHAQDFVNGNWGGVYGADREKCIVYDCIITNNFGSYGGGVRGVTAVRCLIAGNGAGKEAANAYESSLYNCLMYGEQVTNRYVYGYGKSTLNACTVLLPDDNAGVNGCTVCNSYVANERANNVYRYSATTFVAATSTLGEGAFEVKKSEMPLDANYEPVKGNKGIDKGSYAVYTNEVSSAVLSLLALDYIGNPRVSNGEIDLGCGEYDARGDIAAKLRRTGVVVTAATPGVTVIDAGVRLSDGDSLAFDRTVAAGSRRYVFTVSVQGGGRATVMANGVVLVPDEAGDYALEAADAVVPVVITYTGAGQAVVSPLRLDSGFILLFR